MTTATTANTTNQLWPVPKFHFVVDFGTEITDVAFQEISGLGAETQVTEYRQSSSAENAGVKMPGIIKNGNVTLKKGVFINNNHFWEWNKAIAMNTITRITILIKLLDENGAVTMQWQLNNAWPTKITSTDLKSDANEVAIEVIEIAHEGVVVTNGQ